MTEKLKADVCSICLEDFTVSSEVMQTDLKLTEENSLTNKHKRTLKLKQFAQILRDLGRQGVDRDVVRAFPECSHLFHERCLIKWFEENHSCPVCRRKSLAAKAADGTMLPLSDEEDCSSADDDLDVLFFEDTKTTRRSTMRVAETISLASSERAETTI